jgi:hypothetical protein
MLKRRRIKMIRRHRHHNTFVIGLLAGAAVGIAAYTVCKVLQYKSDHEERGIEDEDIKVVKTAYDVLIRKIGVTQEELEEARLSNKTAFELVKDKGFSEEQLINFINHQRYVAIDELVLNRKISREIGDQVKEKIKEHTEGWDGRLC